MIDSYQLFGILGKQFRKFNDDESLTSNSSFSEWKNGLFLYQNIAIPKSLKESIYRICNEIFWSIASLEISIGDFLIIKEPTTDEFETADLLLAHRINLAYEQIYRVWERFTCLLTCLFFSKESKDRFYFNTLIEELKIHKEKINEYKSLARHSEFWNNLSNKRNSISHESASLSNGIEIKIDVSPILSHDGQPLMYPKVTRYLKSEYLKDLKIHFKNMVDLNDVVRSFIISNKENIFSFDTDFPWKKLSNKAPKQGQYMCYIDGGYKILMDDEINNINSKRSNVYWKRLESPPKDN